MNGQPIQHKPGDVVNGHMLSSDGHWLPIGHAASGGNPTYSNPPGQMQGQSPYGYAPQSMVYVQADSSNNTSLAPVTSLVSGLIGLFLCWIPFVGIVGWILGPIALTFGILGLSRGKAEHKIMSWIGITCGAVTLLVCLLYVALIVSA